MSQSQPSAEKPVGQPPSAKSPGPTRWFQRIGPGLITACVVIGPGSILASSRVGSQNGYGLSWVVVVSLVFMMVYMALGAKLGVVARESAGSVVAAHAGRWLSVVIGLSVFFISAAFQFGNNLGVHSAFQVYFGSDSKLVPAEYTYLFNYVIVAFNALAIAFLFGFRNLYKALERLMMLFVALMLTAFAVNLGVGLWQYPPEMGELASGFLPHVDALTDLSVLGLVGTTFVISAAYFQSYLVQQKGWDVRQLKDGLLDARVGSIIMALITLMIMGTAATLLRGETLNNVRDVAQGLKPLFGEYGFGQAIFCLGLFSAAYSSFLINSIIGGFILADGLGLGSKPADLWPRVFTVLALIAGMLVALYVIFTGWNPVPAIVAAQAVTVIAAPLVAAVLWWLTSRRSLMGEMRNRPATNVLAGIGLALLLAIATYTALIVIPAKVKSYRESQTASAMSWLTTQTHRPEHQNDSSICQI